MAKVRNDASGKEATANGRRIDFLGYCFSRGNTRLRKSIKQRFAKKVKRVKNVERKKQVLASYWGWCKWGDCRNLWNTITNNDMSFAEKGIKPQGLSKDGKRFFRNREVQAMEILNRPLQVLDFEPNITTSHGPGRYAVLVLLDGEQEPCKFVTNSLTIKEVLDKAREHDDRLQQLLEMVEDATGKAARSGESFNPADLELSKADRDILEKNKPVFPCQSVLRRRDIGKGKYNYYLE